MTILLDPPRTRRAPITPETRAQHERADAAALSTIKDGINVDGEPEVSSRYALTRTQQVYSLRRSIQRCGQGGHRCGGALCARCSAARSGQFRRDLIDSLRHHKGAAALWTATTATTPARATRQAWTDLQSVLQATTRGGWLKRQGVAGTARAIEPEYTAGGAHVHAHTLLIFRTEIDAEAFRRFALTLRSRYLTEAARLGIPVSANAQDIGLVRSLTRTIGYITKSRVSANGTNAASLLWARVHDGDADALSQLHDLEAGAFRRRAWTTTGLCRPLPSLDDLLAAGALD